MSQPQSRRSKWAGSPEVSLPTAVKVHFSRPSGKCHGEAVYKATFARKSHCQSPSPTSRSNEPPCRKRHWASTRDASRSGKQGGANPRVDDMFL